MPLTVLSSSDAFAAQGLRALGIVPDVGVLELAR